MHSLAQSLQKLPLFLAGLLAEDMLQILFPADFRGELKVENYFFDVLNRQYSPTHLFPPEFRTDGYCSNLFLDDFRAKTMDRNCS